MCKEAELVPIVEPEVLMTGAPFSNQHSKSGMAIPPTCVRRKARCSTAPPATARRGEYIVKVSLTTAIVAPIKTAMHARVSLKKM